MSGPNVFGTVKSVQRGSISVVSASSNTATISAVDPNKCSLKATRIDPAPDGGGFYEGLRVSLTNATTITATARVAIGGVAAAIYWELVEYN